MNLYAYPMSDGIDQLHSAAKAQPDGFYDLFNFRQNRRQRSMLEQTPYFYLNNTFAQGTYYSSGTQTEAASSKVALIQDGVFSMTEYVFWRPGAVQVKAYYQTAFPAANTINTQCMVVLNNANSLGINLGSTLDIVIDGATTFKWRKNGGGYTALVPITTAGVSIDGGNATVYFMTATGFTINDTWSWTRTDAAFDNFASVVNTPNNPTTRFRDDYYFLNRNLRVVKYVTSQANSYVISVGYRPVYGRSVAIYENHLVVGAYSTTLDPVFAGPARSNSSIVGWSDLNDFDAFFPTDVNEADSFRFPGATVNAVSVLNELLYVFANDAIFWTAYPGLPVVFSFKKVVDFYMLNTFENPVVRSNLGVYIIRYGDVWYFDGSNLRQISQKVDPLNTTVTSLPFGVYNPINRELVIVRNSTFFCYQELYDTWYRRSGSFDSNTVPTNCLGIDLSTDSRQGNIVCGCASRIVLKEDLNFGQIPVWDSAGGTAYSTPYIFTNILTGSGFSRVKELTAFYITATQTTFSTSLYALAAETFIDLQYIVTDRGIVTGSLVTDPTLAWSPTSVDGLVSFPHVSFRGIVFRFAGRSTNVDGKPIAALTVQALEMDVRGMTATAATR